MMIELKTIFDYLIAPTIAYIIYLHKSNTKIKEDLLILKSEFEYQAKCCSDLQSIKKDVHKLLIYFEIEHKEKDLK